MDLAMIQRKHVTLNKHLRTLKKRIQKPPQKTILKEKPKYSFISKNALVVITLATLAGCANKTWDFNSSQLECPEGLE